MNVLGCLLKPNLFCFPIASFQLDLTAAPFPFMSLPSCPKSYENLKDTFRIAKWELTEVKWHWLALYFFKLYKCSASLLYILMHIWTHFPDFYVPLLMLGWSKLCCDCEQLSSHLNTVLSHHQLMVINVLQTLWCGSISF